MLAHYCSRQCQEAHWKAHRPNCEKNAASQARNQEVGLRDLVTDFARWVKSQRSNLTVIACSALRTPPRYDQYL